MLGQKAEKTKKAGAGAAVARACGVGGKQTTFVVYDTLLELFTGTCSFACNTRQSFPTIKSLP